MLEKTFIIIRYQTINLHLYLLPGAIQDMNKHAPSNGGLAVENSDAVPNLP